MNLYFQSPTTQPGYLVCHKLRHSIPAPLFDSFETDGRLEDTFGNHLVGTWKCRLSLPNRTMYDAFNLAMGPKGGILTGRGIPLTPGLQVQTAHPTVSCCTDRHGTVALLRTYPFHYFPLSPDLSLSNLSARLGFMVLASVLDFGLRFGGQVFEFGLSFGDTR